MNLPQAGSVALDTFERARESLWGVTGFLRRNSTVHVDGLLVKGTWIIETVRTDDNVAIFLQQIDNAGGQRTVLPKRVCEAIYKHHDSIMKVRRKRRAQRGAETRRQQQA